MLVQVGVLDRTIPYFLRRGLDLVGRQSTFPLGHAILQRLLHARHGLIQEVDQPHGLARPGLEPFPVFALHDPEPDVAQSAFTRRPAGLFRGLEAHVEVLRLAQVRDVDDPVHAERFEAVVYGRDIGTIIPKTTVGLFHYQRERMTF